MNGNMIYFTMEMEARVRALEEQQPEPMSEPLLTPRRPGFAFLKRLLPRREQSLQPIKQPIAAAE